MYLVSFLKMNKLVFSFLVDQPVLMLVLWFLFPRFSSPLWSFGSGSRNAESVLGWSCIWEKTTGRRTSRFGSTIRSAGQSEQARYAFARLCGGHGPELRAASLACAVLAGTMIFSSLKRVACRWVPAVAAPTRDRSEAVFCLRLRRDGVSRGRGRRRRRRSAVERA